MAAPDISKTTESAAGWATLRRFLPYLWPAGEPRLKARVVGAVLLVFAAKGATLTMPFAYKAAIDRMSGGVDATAGLISWRAPIARALVGARVGDERVVRLPAGEKSYEIIAIRYPD